MAEELVALVKSEEKVKQPWGDRAPLKRNLESSAKMETLAADTKHASSS